MESSTRAFRDVAASLARVSVARMPWETRYRSPRPGDPEYLERKIVALRSRCASNRLTSLLSLRPQLLTNDKWWKACALRAWHLRTMYQNAKTPAQVNFLEVTPFSLVCLSKNLIYRSAFLRKATCGLLALRVTNRDAHRIVHQCLAPCVLFWLRKLSNSQNRKRLYGPSLRLVVQCLKGRLHSEDVGSAATEVGDDDRWLQDPDLISMLGDA